VIAGDEHDRSFGESIAEPLELTECKHDRCVRGPHRVEQVACKYHQVRSRRDHAVDCGAKSLGHVGFALVDAA
jgi:hypothetical protein